jgi:hypothetical protein
LCFVIEFEIDEQNGEKDWAVSRSSARCGCREEPDTGQER